MNGSYGTPHPAFGHLGYIQIVETRDMRPEERGRFYVRLRKLIAEVDAECDKEKYDWYMSMEDFAP